VQLLSLPKGSRGQSRCLFVIPSEKRNLSLARFAANWTGTTTQTSKQLNYRRFARRGKNFGSAVNHPAIAASNGFKAPGTNQ
jgi:hypothetical protein